MAVFTSSLRIVLNSSFVFMPKPVVTFIRPSDLDPTTIGYWSDTVFVAVKDVLRGTGNPIYNNGVVTGTLSALRFTKDAEFGGTTNGGSWSLNLGTGTVDAGAVHEAVMTNEGAATLMREMLEGNDQITLSQFNDVFFGYDGNDELWGRDGNDRLDGGTGLDKLNGEIGNDTLSGGSGRDRLDGGAGRDTLIGGAGRDTMKGGVGGDVFIFKNVSESGSAATARDTIIGFQVAAGTGVSFVDRINLEAIDAKYRPTGNDAFSFIGGAQFSAEGQVRAVQVGTDTWIEANTRGATGAEMVIVLTGFTATDITQYDFLL